LREQIKKTVIRRLVIEKAKLAALADVGDALDGPTSLPSHRKHGMRVGAQKFSMKVWRARRE